MKVKQIMTSDVECCCQEDSIQKAAQIMVNEDCGSVPVCEDKRVIGMITDRDIVLRAVAKGNVNAKVQECMSPNAVCCSPDTDAHEAANLMSRHQIRRLPVVDADNKLCGICSIGDLATVDIHINEAGDALSKISEQTTSQSAIH